MTRMPLRMPPRMAGKLRQAQEEFADWRDHTARAWRQTWVLVEAANERAAQPEPERVGGVSLAEATAMQSHIVATHAALTADMYTVSVARKFGAWELQFHMREAGAGAQLAADLGITEPTQIDPNSTGSKFIWEAPLPSDTRVWVRIIAFWRTGTDWAAVDAWLRDDPPAPAADTETDAGDPR